MFEIEGGKDLVRGDLARAVVESGWDLNELRSHGNEFGRGLLATHRRQAASTNPTRETGKDKEAAKS